MSGEDAIQNLLLLALLLIANGSPILARSLLRRHLAHPIDAGARFRDGRRWLGDSKTVRGAVTAILATTLAAPAFGLAWWIGTLIGALAMLGDLASSFVKRRLGIASGAQATGLDHVPESLLPLLACMPLLDLGPVDIILVTLTFMLCDMLLSRWLARLGIGSHPY